MKWMRIYFELISGFYKGSLRYLKYQILTSLLYALAIMPLFWLVTHQLIALSGRQVVNGSSLKAFLMTGSGMAFLGIGFILVLLSLLIELCGYIVIAAAILYGRDESSYWALFKYNLKQLPKMLGFSLILMLIYFAVFIPLSDFGATLSVFDFVRLPKFVYSVIEASTLKLLAYTLVTAIAALFAFRWCFSFHFVLLGNMKLRQAMKASGRLIARNLKYFLQLFFIVSGMAFVSMVLVALAWLLPITYLVSGLNLETFMNKSVVMGLLLTQEIGLSVLALLYFPFEIHHLTWAFYKLVDRDEVFKTFDWQCPEVPVKKKPNWFDRCLSSKRFMLFGLAGVIIGGAAVLGLLFDRMADEQMAEVMSHRAGGFAAPENSLSGIGYAIATGADWIEIDVQRTKDGKYVLYHDDDLKRTAGSPLRLQDLTYEELLKHPIGREIKWVDSKETIPLLEDALDACKGKIKVNIELKGSTADDKMVRDVVAMVRGKMMVRQVMLTSLDYEVIKRIEKDYPSFETGFIYYFLMGDPGLIQADSLILEEGLASEANISKIHSVGKKAIVWTINDEADMVRFVQSEIDAIITDRPEMLKSVMEAHLKDTDQELILNALWDIEF